MLKAINTFYADHYFRSRLEARWAVYFDEVFLDWEYEKEGFDLDGEWYLPDFYFPQYGLYAEIKPIKFTDEEHAKCLKLAELSGKSVIELVGLPHTNPSRVNYVFQKKEGENFDKIVNKVVEADAALLPYSPKESYKPLYFTLQKDSYTQDEYLLSAIVKAKCARFEHKPKNI